MSKMPRFEINWVVSWKEYPLELELNDKWTLQLSGHERVQQIQIKRQSYNTEDWLSGYLVVFKMLHGEQKKVFNSEFSKILAPQLNNLTIENICLYHLDARVPFVLKGYVYITENIERVVDGIQNEQFKEGNQPKSQVNCEFDIRVLQKSLNQLSCDLERLLDQKTSSFSDVTLKWDDVTIPAHKNILSARSPVFAAMFAHPMKESIKNEVDISDIDVNTVRSLLKYMYSGKTSNLTDSTAVDLLLAADKYQLEDLKSVCADFLKDTLSIQNALRILVLGDMIEKDLKAFAMDYICSNSAQFNALIKTEDWNSLKENNPALSMEIITAMTKSVDEEVKKAENEMMRLNEMLTKRNEKRNV